MLGIGAMLRLAGAQTLTGDPRIRAQLRAESGSGVAAARAAHHGAVFPHRERGAGGARQSPGRIRDRHEHRVEAMISRSNKLLAGTTGRALVKILAGL